MALLSLVQFDDLFVVDGEPLVRVDHHTEQARVGLYRRRKGTHKNKVLHLVNI